MEWTKVSAEMTALKDGCYKCTGRWWLCSIALCIVVHVTIRWYSHLAVQAGAVTLDTAMHRPKALTLMPNKLITKSLVPE